MAALARRQQALLTHNYVVVETLAVAQNRLGPRAVRVLVEDVLPPIEVEWVDEQLHAAATSALLAAGRGKLSFIDWVSFELMRRRGIETAFAFDRDFARRGFTTVP